jgi:hypothetical protein
MGSGLGLVAESPLGRNGQWRLLDVREAGFGNVSGPGRGGKPAVGQTAGSETRAELGPL